MINKINNITLESLILFPLFSWISAALFLAGVFFIARKIAFKLLFPNTDNLSVSSFYLLVLSGLGLLGFLVSAAGWCTVNNLRVIAFPFIIMGFLQIYNTFKLPRRMAELFTLENLLLIAFFVLACSAVSDADSVSYHLAAPLQILRNSSNHGLGEYWLHARLIGLGEYINLLGLSFGSDCLGALTQWSVLYLFCKNAKVLCTGIKRDIIVMSILSAPILLFLVNTQKHQLSGDLAFCLSVILFIQFKHEKRPWNTLNMVLLLNPCIYALGLKYNNVLTFGLLFSLFFIYLTSIQPKSVVNFIGVSLLGYFIFLFPVHYFNFINYNDPTGVFLTGGKQAITDFVSTLGNSRDGGWGFPLGIWLPKGISLYTTTMGISGIVFLFGDFHKKERLALMCIGVALFVLQIFFSIHSTRFFLSSFLICILSLSFTNSINFSSWIKLSLYIQGSLSLFMMAISFYTTVPGMITPDGREKSLQKMSFSYTMAKWLDTIGLPKEAILVPHIRAHLFLKQDFIPNEIKYFNFEIFPMGRNYYFTKDHLPDKGDVKLLDSIRILEANRNPFNNKIKTYFLYK